MSPTLLGMLNTPEIIALLVLALLLFGAKKLPELARGLGHGIREFKKATRDVQDELSNAMNAEPSHAPPQSLAPVAEPPTAESPAPPEGCAAPADPVQPVETVSSSEPEPPAAEPPASPEACAAPADAAQPTETASSSEPAKV